MSIPQLNRRGIAVITSIRARQNKINRVLEALDQLSHRIERLIIDNEAAHGEILQEMRINREEVDKRLTWLEDNCVNKLPHGE